jgi:hypothetical protein
MELRQVALGDPPQDQVLLDRGPYVLSRIATGEVREPAHLPPRQISQGESDRGRHVTRLTLTIDVRSVPIVESFGPDVAVQRNRRSRRRLPLRRIPLDEGGPPRVLGKPRALFENKAAELVDPQFGHQKLQPRPSPVLLLAQSGEDAAHGLRDGKELLLGHKSVEELRLMRHRSQTPTHVQLEAPLANAVLVAGHGDAAEIVQLDQAAPLIGASREGDLELAPEVLRVGMAQKEVGAGLRIGRHVEGLAAANTRVRTGGHVPNGVAASLARGDSNGRQPPHQLRGVVDMDEMELKVLAGRHMQDRVGVFLRHVGEDLHLIGGQPAEGNLDPLHAGGVPQRFRTLGEVAGGILQLPNPRPVVALPVVVPLSVNAPAKAGLGKQLLFQEALSTQVDLHFEDIDLAGQLGVDPAVELLFPGDPIIFHHIRFRRESRRPLRKASPKPRVRWSRGFPLPPPSPGGAVRTPA